MSSQIQRINGAEYITAELNALKCLSSRARYDQLNHLFNFPATRSNSYGDVLLDFMRDLGWHKQRNYKITVVNFEKASQRNPNEAVNLKETLATIKDDWSTEKTRVGNRFENNFIVEYM